VPASRENINQLTLTLFACLSWPYTKPLPDRCRRRRARLFNLPTVLVPTIRDLRYEFLDFLAGGVLYNFLAALSSKRISNL
jgi:hypothetical protein